LNDDSSSFGGLLAPLAAFLSGVFQLEYAQEPDYAALRAYLLKGSCFVFI
jgi:hypothetical protein